VGAAGKVQIASTGRRPATRTGSDSSDAGTHHQLTKGCVVRFVRFEAFGEVFKTFDQVMIVRIGPSLRDGPPIRRPRK
jgi:hypothetical protein